MIETTRRSFLRGLGVILAAPAIVTASNLMPISAKKLIPPRWQEQLFTFNNGDEWQVLRDGISGQVHMRPIGSDIMNMPPYLMENKTLEHLIAHFGEPWYMGGPLVYGEVIGPGGPLVYGKVIGRIPGHLIRGTQQGPTGIDQEADHALAPEIRGSARMGSRTHR